MSREIALKKGEAAPDFTLTDQNGKILSLSDYKGKKVLLSFHPLAWTGVCEIQMRTLELKASQLRELNVKTIGISVDPAPSKKAWVEHLGIKDTPLVSDFHPLGEVSRKYGLFIDKIGASGRANILVDENGLIEKTWVYEIAEVPDFEDIIRYLK